MEFIGCDYYTKKYECLTVNLITKSYFNKNYHILTSVGFINSYLVYIIISLNMLLYYVSVISCM